MQWLFFVLEWGPALVAAASAAAAVTPTKRDDRALAALRRVINVLALNVGHARTLEDNDK